MKLLHIDSSILGEVSVSRRLSASIVERQRALHDGLDVTYRDLAAAPLLSLSSAHLAAWQGAATDDAALLADLAAGATIVDELFAADIIVIGAPMYNFTLPTQLKAWVDRVLVAGRTFRYGADGKPEGLLPAGKRVIIASARGGFYAGGAPAAPLDHQESLLITALGFIGLTDITVIRAEGIATGPEGRAAGLALADIAIEALAA